MYVPHLQWYILCKICIIIIHVSKCNAAPEVMSSMKLCTRWVKSANSDCPWILLHKTQMPTLSKLQGITQKS